MKTNVRMYVWGLFLCFAFSMHAQEMSVTGVVSDPSGLPLPGVQVNIKSLKKGVSTDFDGKYTLKANKGDVLVFSFIGYETLEQKVSGSELSVTLKTRSIELEGVVVTALGITRDKKSLGYGTQKLSGDEVTRVPTNNFANALSGKVAGLQIKVNNNFGGSTNMVIRGYKSVNGNNQALIVIDGIPVDNSNTNSADQVSGRGGYDFGNAASDINPNDIESVNVLKGAAAAALYGSRASNGAIMITTKKGKRGQKGLGITYDAGFSFGSMIKSTFPEYQTQYGEGYFPSFRTAFDVNGDGVNDRNVVRTNHDASYGPAYDSNFYVYDWTSFIPGTSNYLVQKPWKMASNGPSTFFETPITRTNTISLSGGTEKGNFMLSYTNYASTGALPNSEQNKNSFLGNASYQLTDRLTANFMGNFIRTKTIGRNGTGYTGNLVAGFRQWWATNVDINDLRDIYEKTHQNYTWNFNTPFNLTPAFWNNPYFERYQNYENDLRNRFLGNVTLNYKVNSWLQVMGRATIDTYNEIQEERRAAGSYGGDPFGIALTNDPSGYSRFDRTYAEFNYDLMLNYDKDFAKDFNIKGTIGVNSRRKSTNSIYASTTGGLLIPGFYSLSNSINTPPAPVESQSETAVDGYYGNASISYKNFVFLEGSLRNDVSSTLPAGFREYMYGAVSSSIIFSDLVKKSWLNFGKFRVGIASVGNDAPFARIVDTYSKPLPFGSGSSSILYAVNATKYNPNLKPERTVNVEFGLEAQFLDRRLGFDFTFFKSNTYNQIVDLPVSTATGYSKAYKNVGNIQNMGYELMVNGTPLKNQDFRWDVTVNWTKIMNEVKELDTGIDNYQLANFQGGVSINATVGQPYGTIKGSDFVYVNGQRLVDNATGNYVLSATNNNVLGTFIPDWNAGINNRFTYRNFTMSFLIDIQKGGSVFSLDKFYGDSSGLYPETVYTNDLGNPVRNTLANGGGLILPGVYANGQPNTIRVDASDGINTPFGSNNMPNSLYVYDASYVKLREVTMGYNLPKKWFKGVVQDMYLGLSGNNLWIIHKNLPYADPESGLSAGNIQGYQSGPMPTFRTFSINLKAKF